MSIEIDQLVFNPPFSGVMSKRERENLNLFLSSGSPGETVAAPTAYVQYYREVFESHSKIGLPTRVADLLISGAFIAAPFVMGTLSTRTNALLTGLVTTAFVAAMGHKELLSPRERLFDRERDQINDHIKYYQQGAENVLTDAANSNFVGSFNQKVQQGQKLTLAELGQLVNLDSRYFKKACEELAITILSVKAMIAMQDGKIEPYKIVNSKDRGFAEGTNRDLILLKLWQQRSQHIGIASAEETMLPLDLGSQNTVEKTPFSLCKTFGKVVRFYADGYSKMLGSIFGKNPTAEDHLPPIIQSFTIPDVKTTPDLDARIRRYGVEFLDLPALQHAAFK